MGKVKVFTITVLNYTIFAFAFPLPILVWIQGSVLTEKCHLYRHGRLDLVHQLPTTGCTAATICLSNWGTWMYEH